jgi:hypothetical protein
MDRIILIGMKFPMYFFSKELSLDNSLVRNVLKPRSPKTPKIKVNAIAKDNTPKPTGPR